METHDVFGYTRRLRAESREGQIKRDYMTSFGEPVASRRATSHAASPPTFPRHTQPSAPPRPPWSAVQSPDLCDPREPASDPQTASLGARWSGAATAAGSSPHWWSCDETNRKWRQRSSQVSSKMIYCMCPRSTKRFLLPPPDSLPSN